MKKRQLEIAYQLHQLGRYQEAKERYENILQEEPKNIDALHGLAIVLAQLSEAEKALEIIDLAISLQQHTPALYNSKGNILLRLKQIGPARQAFHDAIAHKSNYAIAYNNLGNTYFQEQALGQAKKYYEKAVAIEPNLIDTLFNLGTIYAKMGDYAEAIKTLQQALKSRPNSASIHGQLAQIYMQLHQYHEAIDHLRHCLAIQPENGEFHHQLGLALYEHGEFKEATMAFRATAMLQPQNPYIQHHLANAYLQEGDHDAALEHYLKQLGNEPLAESYYNIGVLLMHQQRHKEAAEYLKEASQLDPDYYPIYLNLGAIYLKLNQISKAIENYQQALLLQPDDAEIQHILNALTRSKTPDKAPQKFIEHLFDQYAQFYDEHLTKFLHYDVPKQFYNAIIDETAVKDAEWVILDCGCGTGLSGQIFKLLAKKLIGIDLSSEMIETARKKNVYDQLICDDLENALLAFNNDIDLVIAADVFTYFGDLENIFNLIYQSMKPGALFIFSVEKTNIQPYELQQTIRYAHSKQYIEQLIQKFGFNLLRLNNIDLRRNKNKPVEGYLIILKK